MANFEVKVAPSGDNQRFHTAASDLLFVLAGDGVMYVILVE